jgi:hypothetical protein
MKNTYSVTATRTIISHVEITISADSLEQALKQAETEIISIDFSSAEHKFDESITGVKTISKNVSY